MNLALGVGGFRQSSLCVALCTCVDLYEFFILFFNCYDVDRLPHSTQTVCCMGAAKNPIKFSDLIAIGVFCLLKSLRDVCSDKRKLFVTQSQWNWKERILKTQTQTSIVNGKVSYFSFVKFPVNGLKFVFGKSKKENHFWKIIFQNCHRFLDEYFAMVLRNIFPNLTNRSHYKIPLRNPFFFQSIFNFSEIKLKADTCLSHISK